MSELHYLKGFEQVSPDVFHEITFDFTKEFLKNNSCLNIGCWTGGFESLVGESSKSFLVSVDIDKEALKTAKSSMPEANFIRAEAQKLPFRDASFDVATMFYVIEHLPKEKEFLILEEIKRVLNKEGKLIIVTHNYHWFGNLLDIAYWVVGHRHYKINLLKKMLNEAGFSIDKLQLKGNFITTISSPFFYLFKYLFKKNIYRDYKAIRHLIKEDFKKKGFRDIFLVAKK